jgi:hypothetical protein
VQIQQKFGKHIPKFVFKAKKFIKHVPNFLTKGRKSPGRRREFSFSSNMRKSDTWLPNQDLS